MEIDSIPKIWSGRTVVILGSGPSISNLDLNLIFGKYRTIGVNHSFKLGPVDMLWFGDFGWYAANKADIHAFGGFKATCCPQMPDKPWPDIKKIKRQSKVSGLTTDRSDTVTWNSNSGTSAINVAYHLGATRVLLAGFDMIAKSSTHHWHNFYKGKIRRNFDNHLKHYDAVARDAQAVGLEILNLNPNSAIKQFPFATLEKL